MGGEEGGLFQAKVVNDKVIIISRRGVALPQTPPVLFQTPAANEVGKLMVGKMMNHGEK